MYFHNSDKYLQICDKSTGKSLGKLKLETADSLKLDDFVALKAKTFAHKHIGEDCKKLKVSTKATEKTVKVNK